MAMFFGFIGVAVVLFILALLAVGVLAQLGGGSVNNPGALVFEVYRYTVCFVMVLVFGIGAFIVISTMLTGGDSAALAGNGVTVLLALAIFALHWRMKNPAVS
jgi:hypothetical protein